MFVGSQRVSRATGLLTEGTEVAGGLNVVGLDVLEDVRLHFGGATALQALPVPVSVLRHFRPDQTVQI